MSVPSQARAPAATRGTKVICFEVAGRQFGAELAHVQETIVVRPITRVFLTPSWVAGITNLRGDIVCVLDLAAFLGLGTTTAGPSARIVIAKPAHRRAGLLVDRLAEVRTIDLAALAPPPATLPAEGTSLALGLATLEGGDPLLMLDLAKLLDSDRLKQFRREV